MTRKRIIQCLVLFLGGILLYVVVDFIMDTSEFAKIRRPIFIQPLITGKEDQRLPAFDILLADSITHLNTGNIPEGTPVVLFYFSPYCPYCHKEMQEIVNNIHQLDDIDFYIFTASSFKDMRYFYETFHLERYKNIKIGVDKQFFFSGYFSTIYIPYTAIYGKDKRLKGAFLGSLKHDQIIAVSRM